MGGGGGEGEVAKSTPLQVILTLLLPESSWTFFNNSMKLAALQMNKSSVGSSSNAVKLATNAP